MKKYNIGYTAGTYDLFHVGHLNIFKNAKKYCNKLIVAVSTDELVKQYKHHEPIINFLERKQIVESIKYVDEVVVQENMDKLSAALKYKIDVMFVGDDWQGTEKWKQIEKDLSAYGIDVIYLKHTDSVSSTQIREKLKKAN